MKAPAKGAWTTGLCECCEEPSGCGFCLYAWCCSSCAYGSNVELMETVVCCGGDCCGACLAYVGMMYIGCPCILHMMARGYIRNKYNIPGNGCADCMTTWCCSPCAMCQERRELLIRGHQKGGIIKGDQAAQEAPQQQVMVPVPMPPPMAPGYPAPPASGYPAPPTPGYPAPEPGYPAPAPQGYQAPPQGYQPPPQGYQAPPQGYYPVVPTEGKVV